MTQIPAQTIADAVMLQRKGLTYTEISTMQEVDRAAVIAALEHPPLAPAKAPAPAPRHDRRTILEWTPERVETLRRMMDEGEPFSAIARKLGTTKNACIGKAGRLGFKAKTKPVAPKPPKPKIVVPRQVGHRNKGAPKAAAIRHEVATRQKEPPKIPDPVPPAAELVPLIFGIMGLDNHTCRWPIGDPLLAGFGFCGRPVEGEATTYCPHHTERSRSKGTQSEREAIKKAKAISRREWAA